ncbi:MAG: CaiB/BaiF CoA-transferase family protein [Dehalococcoidia bacterium]
MINANFFGPAHTALSRYHAPETGSEVAMVAPLEGIRVIEIANYVAGPSVGALLRDLGADVIKVEPPGGEAMRTVIPPRPDGTPSLNFLFELENRGKRSVTIDLTAPGAPDVIHEMLSRSDILLTNLVASRQRRFTLDAASVHARNPHVVHVSVTGYGTDGPEADRPAFDFAAFWARSGIMGLMGHPGSPPVISRIAQGDHTTGINGLAATLAALRVRDMTGKGQVVDVSLQQTGVYTIATDVARTLVTGKQPPRFDRTRPENPLFNTYETADSDWIMLVHMTPDPYWPKLCAAIDEPELAEDRRYATMDGRRQHGELLFQRIQARFRARPMAHWSQKLDEHGLIWAPMVQVTEVVQDPQLRHVGAFQAVDHELGRFETVGTPFRIEGADITVRGPSSPVGADTEAVLRELGIDEARVADLAAAGAFG